MERNLPDTIKERGTGSVPGTKCKSEAKSNRDEEKKSFQH